MRSPAHFGRGDALFVQALDAPRIDELVDLLGLVGDLRVALAAMDHLHAELHRQTVEGALLDQVGDFLGVGAADLSVREQLLRDVDQPLLGPMRNQARIGAVFDNRRRPRLAPAGRHAADVHVPPIERPLGRMLLLRAGVGIPDFHRGVDVEHASIVTPLQDFAAVDVPGQVDQQVARREVLGQLRAEVLRRDPPTDEADPLRGPGPQSLGAVLKIQDGDVLQRDAEMPDEDRQRALRHGAITQEQNPFPELDHVTLHESDPLAALARIMGKRHPERSEGSPMSSPSKPDSSLRSE